VYRSFQFDERAQNFICADDETLSVAMRVHNPDRSRVTGSNRKHACKMR
jgi:hypothetical protein